jgi:hypothetical protein
MSDPVYEGAFASYYDRLTSHKDYRAAGPRSLG